MLRAVTVIDWPNIAGAKGQIISKAIFVFLTSSKKRPRDDKLSNRQVYEGYRIFS